MNEIDNIISGSIRRQEGEEKMWTDRRWPEEDEADVGGKEAGEERGRKENRITGEKLLLRRASRREHNG